MQKNHMEGDFLKKILHSPVLKKDCTVDAISFLRINELNHFKSLE